MGVDVNEYHLKIYKVITQKSFNMDFTLDCEVQSLESSLRKARIQILSNITH